MNVYDLSVYVNLEVDDTFTVAEVVRWFNKGIANFNMLSPASLYPFAFEGDDTDTPPSTGMYPSHSTSAYALDDNFMLGVMLPFISASVRSQESSITEKQLFTQEFNENAKTYKSLLNVPADYQRLPESQDLAKYRLGENVYMSDMSFAPFRGDWTVQATTLPEYQEEE